MPYLNRTGDIQIFYDETGAGVPVITTHGFTENGSYWGRTGISAALAESGFRVVDMDMRGHGRSVPNGPNPDYCVEAVQSDIDALADSLGFDKFHLLTHATGGMVGVRYAMKHHTRLLSLIGTNTASMTMTTDKYCSVEWDDKPVPQKKYDQVGHELAKMLRSSGSVSIRSLLPFEKVWTTTHSALSARDFWLTPIPNVAGAGLKKFLRSTI